VARSPPFTIQRVCEVLLTSRSPGPLERTLDRLTRVVSTMSGAPVARTSASDVIVVHVTESSGNRSSSSSTVSSLVSSSRRKSKSKAEDDCTDACESRTSPVASLSTSESDGEDDDDDDDDDGDHESQVKGQLEWAASLPSTSSPKRRAVEDGSLAVGGGRKGVEGSGPVSLALAASRLLEALRDSSNSMHDARAGSKRPRPVF
jgi:hypothetical protein